MFATSRKKNEIKSKVSESFRSDFPSSPPQLLLHMVEMDPCGYKELVTVCAQLKSPERGQETE
jgi:hypothetical protein